MKWCVYQFGNNLKPSNPMESESLWTTANSVWNCKETKLKIIELLFIFHFLVVSKRILPLLLDLLMYLRSGECLIIANKIPNDTI